LLEIQVLQLTKKLKVLRPFSTFILEKKRTETEFEGKRVC